MTSSAYGGAGTRAPLVGTQSSATRTRTNGGPMRRTRGTVTLLAPDASRIRACRARAKLLVLLTSMRWLVLSAAVVAGAVVAGSAASGALRDRACPPQRLSGGYVARVDRALRARRDTWGEALLGAPGGPTYAGARRYLAPLLLARGTHGTRLTRSGFHYVPFTDAAGPAGTSAVALHVADGSQILFDHAGGRSLDVWVGDGRERYGSCRARLILPRLLD